MACLEPGSEPIGACLGHSCTSSASTGSACARPGMFGRSFAPGVAAAAAGANPETHYKHEEEVFMKRDEEEEEEDEDNDKEEEEEDEDNDKEEEEDNDKEEEEEDDEDNDKEEEDEDEDNDKEEDEEEDEDNDKEEEEAVLRASKCSRPLSYSSERCAERIGYLETTLAVKESPSSPFLPRQCCRVVAPTGGTASDMRADIGKEI
ncbi:nucleolin-like [Haliotis rubra]|uniref:nucleolin-like n=1 Tax=Haliotis rubra TaxID=36100 RepID=UPI001EE59419|nr:nucleolin-like [Haliotis rubra]